MLLALLIAASPAVDVAVFPFTAQVNGTFTQHFGHAATFGWQASERFRLVALGYVSNPLTAMSGFRDELNQKTRFELVAPSLLMDAFAGIGTELEPLHLEVNGFPIAFTLSTSLGAASTRVELKPLNSIPALFGDSGWRPGWAIAGGVRVQLSRWLALRLEVRDFIVSSGVSNVNGCSLSDLSALAAPPRAHTPEPVVSSSCRTSTFEGAETFGDEDPGNDFSRVRLAPLARQVAGANRAELQHNVQLMLGLAVTL